MVKRAALSLSSEDQEELSRISQSRTEAAAAVRRAKILLLYSGGTRISDIVREMGATRPLIERCIDKALSFGPLPALKDLPRPGHPTLITDDARAWVLSVACRKPTDLGYAHETWTYSLLIKHLRTHCQEQGHSILAKIGKGRLHDILSKSNIKPHKISYYLERKDPDFDAKMANVLYVYKEVEILNASKDERTSVTVSYDEKPGIQAIKNIAAELMPVPEKYATRARDYEYKRLGTVSLLAGIDLHTGRVIPLVRDRHRSREFIEFLSLLDESYPKDWKVRVVLDNHSSHISKETQVYLRSKPERFEFIFTPKHGSWLNLIEVFFSKMARSLLRHIRVQSKEELAERIYRGIEEFNQEPVIFRWKYKMDETVVADT
ncbi:MAG: IS630 family transposase [Desulfuromonadales bacterium]|nr:IS630 family transposase [Desulfuromonadales bacterium]